MKTLLKIPSNITNFTIGIGICLVSIGTYNILFFNKYLPLSEGWFSVYAHYIQSGAMPYRDFHFFLSPVYPYMISIFTNIFGDGFIGLRILGIVVILCITLLLFLLYSRLFPAYIACIVTIVSVIYWQSNVAFIGYNFISFLHLFALLGAFLICKYFDYDDHTFKSGKGWMASVFLFCAGLFDVLAFLLKQSDGFFVVIFSFLAVAVCAYAKEGLPKALRSVAIYLTGILVPLLALLVWLISNGLLSSFWNQVFVGASSSKGGIMAILFAWIPRIFTLDGIGVVIIATLSLIALRIYCFRKGFMLGKFGEKTYRTNFISTNKIVFIFSVIIILSMLCILLPFWNIDLSHTLEENYFLTLIFYRVLVIGFVISLFLFCIYLLRIFRKKEVFHADPFIILTISLGLLWATSTSGGIGDMGMILALGLLLGYLAIIPSYFNVSKIAFFALCVCIVLFSVSFKYIHPYSWWNLNQPDIRTVSTTLNSKYFNGLIVSEQTARIYSEVTSIVERYTKPGDHIYTFPNIPIFYLLTDRYPNTHNLVSWFDVLPDQLAEEDAHHLIESPPKVIIYLDVPEFVWKFHEIYFRDGKASGQRQIKIAIESLTSSGNYEREAKFDVMDGYTLSVWRLIEGIFDTNTKLLLHNDGTDGSTVFEDEMRKDLTAVGDTHIDTSEKKFGTASASFDGQGDYLTVSNSTDFDFGSEDFTIDGWFYFNTNNIGYQFILDRRGDSDQTGWVFYLETNNSLSFISASNLGWDNMVLYNTGVIPETGKWIHLAVVRNDNVFTMYQNGIAIRSGTYSGAIGAQTVDLTIGAGHAIPGPGFNGYIDELRVSKGIARWTTDFTPPALPSTRESNEESFNDTVGTTMIYPNADDEPALPSTNDTVGTTIIYPNADDEFVLLLHNDGTDGSTVFEDEMRKDLTAVGDAHIDTSEKASGTGSGSFDGQGDYLTVPNSTDFDFGSEDFTIDGWFYFNTNNIGYQFILDRRGDSDQTGWVFYLETNNSLSFLSASNLGWDNMVLYNTGVIPETGKWIHLAVVRNDNVFTMYQNGIAIRSGTYSGAIGAQTVDLTIGAGHAIPGPGVNGYIDELRVSKGIARWTTDFTPPALPSTNDTVGTTMIYPNGMVNLYYSPLAKVSKPSTNDTVGTTMIYPNAGGEFVLLLHNDGTDGSTVFEDEMRKDLTAVGDAHIDTSEKAFGTGSGSFDGQGDYLTVPNSTDFDFGSEDFTIDGWFYFNTNNIGYQYILDRRSDSDQTGWVFYLETNNSLSFLSASNLGWDNMVLYNTGVIPETGKWIHLAVVRNGDVFTMYQNGIAIRSGTYSGAIGAQTVDLTIGAGHAIPGPGVNGYIDELRVSKGIARWTTDFTPPALPSTNDTVGTTMIYPNGMVNLYYSPLAKVSK